MGLVWVWPMGDVRTLSWGLSLSSSGPGVVGLGTVHKTSFLVLITESLDSHRTTGSNQDFG